MKNFFSNLLTKFKNLNTIKKIIFIIFLILAIAIGIFTQIFTARFVRGITIFELPGAPVLDDSSNDDQTSLDDVTEVIGEPEYEQWDGVSRVNVLFLGLDFRDWEAGETPRSDTMILFSVDPISKTAGMLSIPRDLWVNVPGFGHYKINEAYFLGEAQKLPGGGPALAVETVENFIGVPIQYYAQVDFMTFIEFIDLIGGILITPEVDVKVEEFGSVYDQYLKAGQQYTLPGSLALSYARNRYTGDGDFGRAERQQQVILAIKDRIMQYDQLPNLIANAPEIYANLSSGIKTNINLGELIKLLSLFMRDISPSNIQKEVIDTSMVLMTKSPTGLDILKPIPDKIRELRDRVFAYGGALAPIASPAEGSTLVRDEAAIVAIQNGTQVQGLSAHTVDLLRQQGINASEVSPDQMGIPTSIIVYHSKPHTVKYIAELMNVASTNIRFNYDPSVGVDLVVVLGGDWANNNPL
jgi:LCP family protein required for cell wall assembly